MMKISMIPCGGEVVLDASAVNDGYKTPRTMEAGALVGGVAIRDGGTIASIASVINSGPKVFPTNGTGQMVGTMGSTTAAISHPPVAAVRSVIGRVAAGTTTVVLVEVPLRGIKFEGAMTSHRMTITTKLLQALPIHQEARRGVEILIPDTILTTPIYT